MNIPHDPAAEKELVGAVMLHNDHLDEVTGIVEPDDFYVPAYRAVYEAILSLWHQERKADAVTVLDELKHQGSFSPAASEAAREAAFAGGVAWQRHAEIVARHALSRRILATAQDMQKMAQVDPDGAIAAASQLGEHQPIGALPRGLTLLSDVLHQAREHPQPWVIPGLLRVDWRIVLVGMEGYGKSSILYQMALLAAHGIHPFAFSDMPPQRVLFVDCENPEGAVQENCEQIERTLTTQDIYNPKAVVTWRRPEGINLRLPHFRREFEASLRDVKPDLVILGPAYKVYEKGRDTDEDAVRHLQLILDRFRIRHHFGLLMEHHAPKSQGGVRDLDPYGTSLWLRWPEAGLKLMPLKDDGSPTRDRTGHLGVRGWRGRRLTHSWPDQIDRAGAADSYPWVGRYPDGHLNPQPPPPKFQPRIVGNDEPF